MMNRLIAMLAAVEKSEGGLYGVVAGMMAIELLAYTMRPDRGRFAAAGCSSMGRAALKEITTVVIYCGNQA